MAMMPHDNEMYDTKLGMYLRICPAPILYILYERSSWLGFGCNDRFTRLHLLTDLDLYS